jgi:hypothetical protein
MKAESGSLRRNLRQIRRRVVKSEDEKIAEMGLLKLIEVLCEKKRVAIKKNTQLKRKVVKKNLRVNKNKKATEVTSIGVKDIEVSNKEDKKYIPKEAKLTVPEEPQSQSRVQASNSPCSNEDQKLPLSSILNMGGEDKKEVKQLKKESDRNNSRHEAIAKLIQSKKTKVKFGFILGDQLQLRHILQSTVYSTNGKHNI